jgi:translation initiation factor 1 (eIF-1/SUI1)
VKTWEFDWHEFNAFFIEIVDRVKNGIYICGSLNPNVMTVKGVNDLDHTLYTDYPEFEREYANITEPNTLPPEKQTLIVGLVKRKMDGAPMTYITGFVGKRIDMRKIEDALQGVCHTCGSSKMHDIILNGDVRKRAYVHLRSNGYRVKFAEN